LVKEEIDVIFEKVRMPSLLLTKLKVGKSKGAIQEAFSVLNGNMRTIDHNMKDLLFLVKDMAQILYISFDQRINNLTRT